MEADQLILNFHRAYPYFDQATILKIADHGNLVEVAKNECLIRYGQVDKHIGFVVQGLFKGTILENDEEQTLWFSNEYDILASYMSIFRDEPSKLTYTALEKSKVVLLQYETIKDLAAGDLAVASGMITMLENLLLESFHRLEKYILYSPEDRYLKLLREKPDILNRVPQKLLASYIGITPVSLSRLRARLSRK